MSGIYANSYVKFIRKVYTLSLYSKLRGKLYVKFILNCSRYFVIIVIRHEKIQL